MTVEQFKIGFRVLDTPGIPNVSQVSAKVKTQYDLGSLMARREMTILPMNIKQGYSIWLGALVRLDFVSGEDKYLTFFVPTDTTIHRTPIAKSIEVFTKQAGKLFKPTYFTNPDLDENDRLM